MSKPLEWWPTSWVAIPWANGRFQIDCRVTGFNSYHTFTAIEHDKHGGPDRILGEFRDHDEAKAACQERYEEEPSPK